LTVAYAARKFPAVPLIAIARSYQAISSRHSISDRSGTRVFRRARRWRCIQPLGGGVSSASRNRAGQKIPDHLVDPFRVIGVEHIDDLGRAIEHRQTGVLCGQRIANSTVSSHAERPGSWTLYQFRDGGLLPVICPTCQNVFAGSLMPATARLLCMGLFSIFWFATGRLGRNGRLVTSPDGPDGRGEDDPRGSSLAIKPMP